MKTKLGIDRSARREEASMWRRLILAAGSLALVLLLAHPLLAADKENLTVASDAMVRKTMEFAVEGVRVANPGVCKIEVMDDPREVRILGIKPGTTDAIVSGPAGATYAFSITVMPNSKTMLEALRRDLEQVPEIDMYENMGRVMIRGEVSNPNNWQLLQRIVQLYGGTVANLATFRPGPERIIELKKALEVSGFKIAPKGSANLEPETLAVDAAGSNINISGSVYSKADLEKIKAVVASQRWLGESGKAGDTNSGLGATVNVSIIPTMLELDVVFVAISETDFKQLGGNLLKDGLLTVQSALNYGGQIGRDQTAPSGWGGNYLVGTGLNGTIGALSRGGPMRSYNAGHMTFKNYADEMKTFKSGGTLKVKVGGVNTAELKDIEYGLILNAKGGLSNRNTAELDVVLEMSVPLLQGNGDYNLTTNKINSTVLVPVGSTLIMGGADQLFESVSSEGVPFLKNIPVMKYFFSSETTTKEKQKLLILLSPQLAGPAQPGSVPLSETTKKIQEEMAKPIKDLAKPAK